MCHVLVIEDEPMVAMLIQDILEDAGATSFAFAATEQDAVDLAMRQVPELIASDVHLIEGTGPRAVSRIQEHVGAIPVIFITATPDDCRPCNPPGVVLVKPIRPYEVASAFRELAPA